MAQPHAQPQEVINRLARAEGHVRSIKEMAQRGDVSCVELLTQIAAVRAALDQAGKTILAHHLETCVVGDGGNDESKETLAELLTALERFLK